MIRKVRNVKIGQTIKIIDAGDDNKIEKKYSVIKVYRFYVLKKNAIGIKRCFSYGHLVQMGLEK